MRTGTVLRIDTSSKQNGQPLCRPSAEQTNEVNTHASPAIQRFTINNEYPGIYITLRLTLFHMPSRWRLGADGMPSELESLARSFRGFVPTARPKESHRQLENTAPLPARTNNR